MLEQMTRKSSKMIGQGCVEPAHAEPAHVDPVDVDKGRAAASSSSSSHSGLPPLSILILMLKSLDIMIDLDGTLLKLKTKLDMSGKMRKDAILLVPEIVANKAWTSLNMSNNNLGHLMLPSYWTEVEDADWNITYTHADGRKQQEHPGKQDCIIAIADAIPTMGVLTHLDISKNNLTNRGKDMSGVEALAAAIPQCK